MSQVKGFRRVFAHSAAVFHERGIANTKTNEVSSLACEEHSGEDILMSVFEVPATKETFKASSRLALDAQLLAALRVTCS